jgi:hypothetical protein
LVLGSVPVTGLIAVDDAGEAPGAGVVTLGSLALVPMSHAASPRRRAADAKAFIIAEEFIDGSCYSPLREMSAPELVAMP